MLASFLITFREALEAALIIGIIAAYLAKMGRKDLYRYLYMGAIGAVIASIGVALIFKILYGELESTAEQLFEAAAALIAAVVLTYMIFWMASNSKKIKGELQEKIEISISEGQMMGIAALSFISVFREGVETVLFLGTLAITSPLDTLSGFILGVVAVVLLSLYMFKGIHRLDVNKFFKYTSILLVLFSAGLIATGVHALNEAGVMPAVVEHVWDLSKYPSLQEESPIGGGLKSLFGFDASPSLTEVLAYIGYWLVIGLFVYRTYRVTAASKAGEVKTYGS